MSVCAKINEAHWAIGQYGYAVTRTRFLPSRLSIGQSASELVDTPTTVASTANTKECYRKLVNAESGAGKLAALNLSFGRSFGGSVLARCCRSQARELATP
ncbi:hypothetical protein RE2895_38710 [Rhodococcus erythropolis]|nr:hypothetical protein RE2895_38710 [Rhodococcus erythropolis]